MLDLGIQLLFRNLHALLKELKLVCALVPPHGVEFRDSGPKCCGDVRIFFLIDFHDAVIIAIDENDKVFVNLLPDVFLNFGRAYGLES